MVDSSSSGAPAKATRWDLADTEGYGGGNCVSLAPWMFSGYVGLYRRKKYVGACGAHETGGRPVGVGAPSYLGAASAASSGSRSFQKSRSRRFHSVWTPFDIPFL